MLGNSQRLRANVSAWGLIGLSAGYFAFWILPSRAELNQNFGSFDMYAWVYPNILYALQAIEQGHGLLWNTMQNCGQPFMAILPTALFYPLSLLFLIVDLDSAMLSLIALHLAIGGIGSYVLLEEFDLGPIARLSGALAFELGAITLYLSAWVPQIAGAYVWLPWAMYLCERVLKSPRYVTGAGLGVILTVELLAGYPQLSVFIYQLIALRVGWELLTRRGSVGFRTIGVLLMAMVVPLLLGAVQMMPAFELVGESVRQAGLSSSDIRVQTLSWQAFREQVAIHRSPYGDIVLLIPMALAILGLLRSRARRMAVFSLLVTIFYLSLSFSETAFELYAQLPLGSLFREPNRFLWPAAFSFSILVAFGAAVVVEGKGASLRLRGAPPVACLLSVAILYWLAPSAVSYFECALLLGLVVASIAAQFGAVGPKVAGIALPVLLAANLITVGARPALGLIPDSSIQFEHAEAFEYLKSRMTLQDRVHLVGTHGEFSLVYKSASIFNVPSIADYEPQASLRYAQYFTYMMRNGRMKTLSEFYYPLTYAPKNRYLFNLAAARYILVDQSSRGSLSGVGKDFREIWRRGGMRIYENPRALPRAYLVSEYQVMADADSVLKRLALRYHEPRRRALLTGQVPDGFPEAVEGATGEVEIIEDLSEELRLSVDATADTYLMLTDQYYPGWEATVNGVPTPIAIANHAFRMIGVPAGHSEVVFRYRPMSLRVGSIISAISAAGLGILGWIGIRRRLAASSGTSSPSLASDVCE